MKRFYGKGLAAFQHYSLLQNVCKQNIVSVVCSLYLVVVEML